MAAAAALAPSLNHHLAILHRFILRRPTPPIFHRKQVQPWVPLKRTAFSTSIPFSPIPHAVSEQLTGDAALHLDNNELEEDASSIAAAATSSATASEVPKVSNNGGLVKVKPPPSLTIKEKKELASYAHSLGKKLKSQQVGKSGVTDTVVMALVETLEANELLKLKIHNTCPGEMEDVVKQLEEYTGSITVGQIGRTVILYRPSLTKLKVEEKRRQAQSAYLKKQSMPRPSSPQSRRPLPAAGEETRQFGRGRRGRSRF